MFGLKPLVALASIAPSLRAGLLINPENPGFSPKTKLFDFPQLRLIIHGKSLCLQNKFKFEPRTD
jgi:hypothetical protein